MRNKILLSILSTVLLVSTVACNKTISYTYKVSTGDYVEVELKTTEDYKLKTEGSGFNVLDGDGNEILTGYFMGEEDYEYLVSEGKTNTNATVIENSPINVFEFDYTEGDYSETNFVVWVGSNTGIHVKSTQDRELAEDVFEMLTFEIE